MDSKPLSPLVSTGVIVTNGVASTVPPAAAYCTMRTLPSFSVTNSRPDSSGAHAIPVTSAFTFANRASVKSGSNSVAPALDDSSPHAARTQADTPALALFRIVIGEMYHEPDPETPGGP